METVPAYASGGLMPNLGQATDQATTTASAPVQRGMWMGWGILIAVSVAASAYHGFRRSGGDYGTAAGWGLFGLIAPVITPAVALIQGYAKPKVRSNRRRNRSRRRG